MGPGRSQRRLRWPRSAVCHCVKPPAAFTALPGPLSSPAGSDPRVWGCVWVHTRPRASCPDGPALPGPGPGPPRKVRRVWRWHGDSHSPSICSRDAPCPPSDRRPCESLAPGGAPCRRRPAAVSAPRHRCGCSRPAKSQRGRDRCRRLAVGLPHASPFTPSFFRYRCLLVVFSSLVFAFTVLQRLSLVIGVSVYFRFKLSFSDKRCSTQLFPALWRDR